MKVSKDLGLQKYGDLIRFLNSEYSITHDSANLIALKVLKTNAQSMESEMNLVDLPYSEPKEKLWVYL